jgi:hypothetical protein
MLQIRQYVCLHFSHETIYRACAALELIEPCRTEKKGSFILFLFFPLSPYFLQLFYWISFATLPHTPNISQEQEPFLTSQKQRRFDLRFSCGCFSIHTLFSIQECLWLNSFQISLIKSPIKTHQGCGNLSSYKVMQGIIKI